MVRANSRRRCCCWISPGFRAAGLAMTFKRPGLPAQARKRTVSAPRLAALVRVGGRPDTSGWPGVRGTVAAWQVLVAPNPGDSIFPTRTPFSVCGISSALLMRQRPS